jgi:RNA polymerase sigma-70 factor (ECF subfamily)
VFVGSLDSAVGDPGTEVTSATRLDRKGWRLVRGDETDDDAKAMAEFVRTRDRRMFERIFQKYRRAMVAHARRYVRDAAKAEELAQEIFVRVYTTKAYEPTAKFKTWLYRVGTNVCLNEIRRPEHQQKMETLEGADDPISITPSEIAAPPGTPEEAVFGKQMEARVQQMVDGLPVNQRAAFLMSRQDHLSLEEIAEALETSVSAVKSLIHRALETLRKGVASLSSEAKTSNQEAVR